MNRLKTGILSGLSGLTRLCVRHWCNHPQTNTVEAYVVYVTTWVRMETNEQGAYSEVSGKFQCVHCGKILLGRYPCRTTYNTSEEDEDENDDDEDEDDGSEDTNMEGTRT
jgi:hypothetical protein